MSDRLKAFALVVAALFALRLFFGFVLFPVAVVPALSVLNAALFVGLSVYAMYAGAAHPWGRGHAFGLLCAGVALHVLGAALARYVSGPGSPAEVFYMALGQTGIMLWTLGLGALLASFLRDRNLLLPIAVFLIGADMFLVFNPDSPTRRMLAGSTSVTQNVLATVPAAKSTEAPKAGVRDLAQIGPADLLFAAAFFALLWRFGMRAKRTVLWLVPVLVVYLLVVVVFSDAHIGPIALAMLPAMVPIGVTTLLVNAREFKLQRQEAMGVWLIALVSVALAAFGVYRASRTQTAPPVAPLTSGGDQASPTPEGSP